MQEVDSFSARQLGVLIYPYWNVKTAGDQLDEEPSLCFNRSTLECKVQQRKTRAQTSLPF